ncbi:MAG: ABC transporter permease [Ktedonobacterales bacterium]|nr:ABC transporter permease [Ktedonobacterales bacterium]
MMTAYLIRRLSQAILLLLVLSIAFFLLVHALPGGPQAVLFSPRMTAETRANLEHLYGLDQSLPVQYLLWFKNVLGGNFGNSFSDGQLVTTEIAGRIPPTLELFGAAMSFTLVLAVLLGVLSAVRKYSLMDYMVTVLAYFGISMPVFWFALILQEFIGVQLHLLPTSGRETCSIYGCATPFDVFVDGAQHLLMPMFVLSLLFLAGWSRYLRASMIEVLNQDYVRTARAKGLSPRTVIFRHALRNALIPFVTQVAIDVGLIFGGAVVTETVFAWPGLGRLFYDALSHRDFPILEALLLLGSASVIFLNLFADVLYSAIDPRIRYS